MFSFGGFLDLNSVLIQYFLSLFFHYISLPSCSLLYLHFLNIKTSFHHVLSVQLVTMCCVIVSVAQHIAQGMFILTMGNTESLCMPELSLYLNYMLDIAKSPCSRHFHFIVVLAITCKTRRYNTSQQRPRSIL